MKLKTASILQVLTTYAVGLLFLPFSLIFGLLNLLTWPFEQLIEWRFYINNVIGNKLLRNSEEVKNGYIQNQEVIRTKTALYTYLIMKAQEQKNKN